MDKTILSQDVAMNCINDSIHCSRNSSISCHHVNNNTAAGSGAPPGLDPISDESSLDDSMNSQRQNNVNKSKKRVSWDKIHTREYSLVVGDHPMCQDGLPVSLGWQYNDGTQFQLHQQQQLQQQLSISERKQSYVFPRRLSYEERKDRLVAVSNLTLDQIKNDEIDLVVRTLKESWEDVTTTTTATIDDNITANYNMDEDDPFADMMALDDLMPGLDFMGVDDDTLLAVDELGDITNFEWTDDSASSSSSP